MKAPRQVITVLTARERQVVGHAALGRSNKAIAYSLGLSPSTVSTLLDRARKRSFSPEGEGLLTERPPPQPITRINDRLVCASASGEPLLYDLVARALTQAERDVVALVLRGLTNAAIAERRHCSPRTVANQLSSAYRKLQVSGRRELWAKFGR